MLLRGLTRAWDIPCKHAIALHPLESRKDKISGLNCIQIPSVMKEIEGIDKPVISSRTEIEMI